MLDLKESNQIQLQRLQKVRIWVQQINYITEVLKLKQKLQKNKVITGKTLFFVVGPFLTHHFICLRIDF